MLSKNAQRIAAWIEWLLIFVTGAGMLALIVLWSRLDVLLLQAVNYMLRHPCGTSAMLNTQCVGHIPGVLDQLRSPQHAYAKHPPFTFILYSKVNHIPITPGKWPIGRDHRMPSTRPLRRPTAVDAVIERVGHPLTESL